MPYQAGMTGGGYAIATPYRARSIHRKPSQHRLRAPALLPTIAGMVRWLAPVDIVARLALPPRCAGCGLPVGRDHHFCAALLERSSLHRAAMVRGVPPALCV